MATELDPDTAWREDAPHELRSRYSGCPLKPTEMIITILAQGSFSFGHQVIVFEWGHGFDTADCYRKHKAFHLYPEEGQSARADELGLFGSAAKVVPGRIERLRATAKDLTTGTKSTVTADGSKGSHGRQYADQELSQTHNGNFMKGAKYRSWSVQWETGNTAFQEAKRQWKNAKATPSFNLLGWGGHNCGTWTQAIASLAGVPATSYAAKFGFPVPVWEVYGAGAVKNESEMWDSRKTLTQPASGDSDTGRSFDMPQAFASNFGV